MEHNTEFEQKIKDGYDDVPVDSFDVAYGRIQNELTAKQPQKKKIMWSRVAALAACAVLLCCMCATIIVNLSNRYDSIYDDSVAKPIAATRQDIVDAGVQFIPDINVLPNCKISQVNHKYTDETLYFKVMGAADKNTVGEIQGYLLKIVVNEKYRSNDEEEYNGRDFLVDGRTVRINKITTPVGGVEICVGYKVAFEEGSVKYRLECISYEHNGYDTVKDFLGKFLANDAS